MPTNGSPACAWIDPNVRPATNKTKRLPRMRGDRPYVVDGGVAWKRAPPACAGIDPARNGRS